MTVSETAVPATAEKPAFVGSPAAVQSIIQNIITHLETKYCVPSEGNAIAAGLRAKDNGEFPYSHNQSLPLLADLLNEELARLSNDKHLQVVVRDEEILNPKPEPTEEKREQITHAVVNEGSGEDWAEDYLNFNNGVTEVRVLDGNIGYLRIDLFPGSHLLGDTYAAAFQLLSNTLGLIIDMRFNGGGDENSPDLLLSYLMPPSRLPTVSMRDRTTNTTTTGHLYSVVPGKRYGADRPVWVLTSARTFSAAEHFTFCAKASGRATIVGENTAGGGRSGNYEWIHPRMDIFIPSSVTWGELRGPLKGKDWEGVGVAPDVACTAAEAMDVAWKAGLEVSIPALESGGGKSWLKGRNVNKAKAALKKIEEAAAAAAAGRVDLPVEAQ